MILGIDANSRKVAIFALDGDTAGTKVIQVPPKVKNRAVLCAQLYTECHEYFTTLPTGTVVFIEKPLGARNINSTIVQAQANGVVQAAAISAGMEQVLEVNVASWKGFAGYGARADKSLIQSWLRTHYPTLADHAGDDGDLTDAAVIAIYGREVCRRGANLEALLGKGQQD